MIDSQFLKPHYYGKRQSLSILKTILNQHLTTNKWPKIIQITGTNGKGSVSQYIAVGLQTLTQQKVGLFTSPHILAVNERIQVNQQPISDNDFLQIYTELKPSIDQYNLSFFAILTLIALIYFIREQQVDVVVLEVGIGGRLDATSMVANDIAVITSLGKDHQELLGKKLKQIFAEKRAIIGSHTSQVFANKTLPQWAQRSLKATGHQVFFADKGKTYLATNRNLALFILTTGFNLPLPAVEKGLANINWPLRYQKFNYGKTTLIFDAAHNVQGIKATINALKVYGDQVDIICFSCLKTKKPDQLKHLLKRLHRPLFEFSNSHPHSISGERFIWPAIIDAQASQTVLIIGSCYFVADVYQQFQKVVSSDE